MFIGWTMVLFFDQVVAEIVELSIRTKMVTPHTATCVRHMMTDDPIEAI